MYMHLLEINHDHFPSMSSNCRLSVGSLGYWTAYINCKRYCRLPYCVFAYSEKPCWILHCREWRYVCMRKYICTSVVVLPIWWRQKEISVTWSNRYITVYGNLLSLYINISGRHWTWKFVLKQNNASKNCCPCVICSLEPDGLDICMLAEMYDSWKRHYWLTRIVMAWICHDHDNGVVAANVLARSLTEPVGE